MLSLSLYVNDYIIEMSKEFDQMKGVVTCEVSIHKNLLSKFENFVEQNTNIKLGRWVVIECETCVDYHGKGYLHASIEKFSKTSKKTASDNIMLIKKWLNEVN